MDYDPMVMDDGESLGPVVKISQVCLSSTRLWLSPRVRGGEGIMGLNMHPNLGRLSAHKV